MALGTATELHRGSCRAARPRSSPTIARIGVVGQLRPDVASSRGLPAGIVVVGGELDLGAFRTTDALARPVTALPRQPAVVRDLSILIDAGLPAASVRGTIRANAPATLEQVREFDRYEGKGVPRGASGIVHPADLPGSRIAR